MERKIWERVRANADKKKGLTNDVVKSFCSFLCGKDFKGVFSADRVPVKYACLPHFIMVVNTGRRGDSRDVSKLPVGHFVTVVVSPSTVYYLDPYGLPCTQRDLLRFFKLCHRPLACNRRQIQDYGSMYCGVYAILFAAYADADCPFEMRFCKKRLRKNDKKCVAYLKKLIAQRR